MTQAPLLQVRGLTKHFPILKGALFPKPAGAVRAVERPPTSRDAALSPDRAWVRASSSWSAASRRSRSTRSRATT